MGNRKIFNERKKKVGQDSHRNTRIEQISET